jgi:hypothetical protein
MIEWFDDLALGMGFKTREVTGGASYRDDGSNETPRTWKIPIPKPSCG